MSNQPIIYVEVKSGKKYQLKTVILTTSVLAKGSKFTPSYFYDYVVIDDILPYTHVCLYSSLLEEATPEQPMERWACAADDFFDGRFQRADAPRTERNVPYQALIQEARNQPLGNKAGQELVARLASALERATTPSREVMQIAQRLQAVAHIPIEDRTTSQKHYGFKIGVGDNTLESLWHCTDDRRHPDDTPEFYAQGGDSADLYCDGHYPTVDDIAALTFLTHSQQDIQTLLAAFGLMVRLGVEVDVEVNPTKPLTENDVLSITGGYLYHDSGEWSIDLFRSQNVVNAAKGDMRPMLAIQVYGPDSEKKDDFVSFYLKPDKVLELNILTQRFLELPDTGLE